MGLKSSILLHEEDIEELQNETGFSSNQIRRLYSRFKSLDKATKGTLSRADFISIPELAINPIGERIIDAFFMNEDSKESGEETCNFRQFVRTLAHFRPFEQSKENPLNTREKKLQFTFKIYDLDNDGKISKDDLMQVLHMMVGRNISDEQLGGIADRAISDADLDKDGVISFEELKRVLENVDMNSKMSIRFLA
ncbi:calcineurin B homologous protein 1-like [Stylophora pistillata]|uniref:Calcineurin B-likeous protein 1 n=1 Tax=Stylophora pistillata TaxID=50429 RepID=A0A2B4RL37_STYPI|nr:calcineurin B homologous protein 1-like [Stylophora pistillata]PFX16962.1 Calcineurin B-likeous protein 1 [Stylophora pistillata]